MSTDVTVQSILSNISALNLGADQTTLAIAGGGGQSVKRISIEGGAFRKFVGGKEVAVIEDRFMNVIVVNAAPNFSRTYYNKPYKKGVVVPPTCWSANGEVPSPEVKNKQAADCNSCPFSIKGSGENGIGAACRRSWRIAVVLPHDPDGDVLQVTIPDKSLWGKEEAGKWPWKAYVKMLATNNVSVGHVVTKMQFDISQSAPRLLFSPAAVINMDDLPILREQGASAAALAAVNLTASHIDAQGSDDVVGAEPEPAQPQYKEPAVRVAASAPPASSGGGEDMAEKIRKWASKKGV